MGAGVALQIAKRYPWIAEKLQKAFQYEMCFHGQGGLRLGECYVFAKKDAPYTVLNLVTQRGYGRVAGKRYASYDAIDEAFAKVAERIGEEGRLSIPRIGAGLGGAEWRIVEAIIDTHLDRDQEVTVWTPY
jgi:O-acetyl-ADP-ribose deacetylase (regulator of RNase III)